MSLHCATSFSPVGAIAMTSAPRSPAPPCLCRTLNPSRWSRAATISSNPSRPDRRPYPRHRRRTRRGRTEVLGRQGLSGRWRFHPGALPRPSPQALAQAQQHPRQDPLPRRAGHGHPQRLAAPAEAPPWHQPHPRPGEGSPRASPRISVRLEKAHAFQDALTESVRAAYPRARTRRMLLRSPHPHASGVVFPFRRALGIVWSASQNVCSRGVRVPGALARAWMRAPR